MSASADRSGEPGSIRSDTGYGPRNIRRKNDLIGLFTRHRTAANLLMVLMLVAGFFGLYRMTTQFFPDFGIDVVLVSVAWPGASASDVDSNIVQAVEREVRFIDSVKAVKSSAFEGRASIAVEFEPGSDMQSALSNIETAVGQVTTLPQDSETPIVRRIVRYDTLSRILVSGPYSGGRAQGLRQAGSRRSAPARHRQDRHWRRPQRGNSGRNQAGNAAPPRTDAE